MMMTLAIAALLMTGLVVWTMLRNGAAEEPKVVPVRIDETRRRNRR